MLVRPVSSDHGLQVLRLAGGGKYNLRFFVGSADSASTILRA
jgi:hypothetical protein